MTQDAVVTQIFPNNMAEVAVVRGTACGSNCGNCESCLYQNELKTMAKNRINAMPGQKVIIQSKSSRVFSAAMLVYVMPLVLFLIGYAVAYILGASEGLCVAVSFCGLVIGGVVLVVSQRMRKDKNPITFDIVRFAGASEAV